MRANKSLYCASDSPGVSGFAQSGYQTLLSWSAKRLLQSLANLRKSLSRRLTGSLQPDDINLANIDTVQAVALADRLGARLLKMKWAADSSTHENVIELLIRRAKVSRAVAILGVHEYMESACSVCQGRERMEIGTRVIVCTACANHPGIKRYSDRDRAAYLRISLARARRLSSSLHKVRDTIDSWEKEAHNEAVARLK
jgi:hypothetical protein